MNFSRRRLSVSAAVVLTLVAATVSGATSASAADVVIIRTLPVTSGPVLSSLSWDVLYKVGGTSAADGATLTELMGGLFTDVVATCAATSGGASCPTLTTTTTSSGTLVTGTVATFPNNGEIKIHFVATLPAVDGNYQLTGKITHTGTDELPTTDTAISQIYARPIATDLFVSHSDSISGGANGIGGASGTNVAALNGETDPVASFPRTATFRIGNNGPDSVPNSAIGYKLLTSISGSVRSGLGTRGSETLVGAGAQYMNTVPNYATTTSWSAVSGGIPASYARGASFAVPLTCTTVGALVCPASTVYYVAGVGFGGTVRPLVSTFPQRPIGWLTQAPEWVVDPTNHLVLSAASYAAMLTSPFPGQSIGAGDAATFTAVWTDPTATLRTSLVPGTDALSPTSTVTPTLSCTPVDSAHLVDQSIAYLGLVNDVNLANNTDFANAAVTRTCLTGDVQATVAVNSGGDATVTDGETITTVFTIKNAGAGTATRMTGGISVPVTNWSGFSMGAPSCVSSAPSTSPCPSTAALAAAILPANSFVPPSNVPSFYSATTQVPLSGFELTAGTTWTITVASAAGSSVCTPSTTGLYGAGTEYIAITTTATGPAFRDPIVANNTATSSITLAPQACPKPANFDLATTLVGPLDAAGNPVSTVTIDGQVYLKITATNSSTNSVLVNNAVITGGYTGLSNPYQAAPASSSVYGKHQGGATGLPIVLGASSASPVVADSGVVCTAFGGAVCPTSLYSTSLNQGMFSDYTALIPTLPAVNIDPSARVELLIPYTQLGVLAEVGGVSSCLPSGVAEFTRNNQVSIAAYNGDLGYNGLPTTATRAVITEDNGAGAVIEQARWQESNSVNNVSRAGVTSPEPLCPTGHVLTVDESVAAPSSATSLGASDIAAFDIVVGNSGSTGMDQVSLQNSQTINCTNGIESYSANPCGSITGVTMTCSVIGTAGGICPTAIVPAPTSKESAYYIMTWGTLGDFTTLPAGAQLKLHFEYTIADRSQFTQSVVGNVLAFGPGKARVRYDVNSFPGNPVAQAGPVDSATITLPASPGLAITKTVDHPLAAPGDIVTYAVTVLNGSVVDQPAGTLFADPLPAGLDAFTSATCQPTAGPAPLPVNLAMCPTVTNSASGVSAVLPIVPANSGLKFTITAVATDALSSVNNSASVTTPYRSLLSTTNFAVPSSSSTQSISGFKAVYNVTRPGAQDFAPGDRLDYVVSYANTSIFDIANFQIEDPLPAGVSYGGGMTVAASGAPTDAVADSEYTGTTLANTLVAGAVIASGGVVTVRIPVTVDADFTGTTIANQALGTGTGIRTPEPTDNVDDRNPACPEIVAGLVCLPAGVVVTIGSVQQAQGDGTAPNGISQQLVVGPPVVDPPATDPVTAVPSTPSSTGLAATGISMTVPVGLGGLLLGLGAILVVIKRRSQRGVRSRP